MCPVPLKTERLILRDFAPDDWRSVHEYASDPEVVKYVEWGPNKEPDSKDFIERVLFAARQQPRHSYDLAVTLAADGRLVGAASIHVSSPAHREAWIGYCLNKEVWGRGIATEAGRALIEFGFGELGLHRIFATCDPLNLGSSTVLKKLGMNLEGCFREHKLVRGKWRDTELFAILEHAR